MGKKYVIIWADNPAIFLKKLKEVEKEIREEVADFEERNILSIKVLCEYEFTIQGFISFYKVDYEV